MKDLVTIGITSYCSKDTITEAIRSANEQDYENIEVLVVDDCSPDGTGEFLEELQKKYGFRLVRLKENRGVANARNVLIANANGSFLAFFDDDDTSLPCRISTQVASILSVESVVPGPVASFVARTQIYPNGARIYEPALALRGHQFVPAPEVLKWALLGRYGSSVTGAAGSGTTMARTSVFRQLRGYDEAFKRFSDTDFLIRFASSGGVVVGIQDPLLNQGMTIGEDKSVSAQERSHEQLLKKHQEYLKSQRLYSSAKLWLEIKYGILNRTFSRALIGVIGLIWVNPGFVKRALVLAWQRRSAILLRSRTIKR